jgi:hypothetical protein
VVIVAAHVVINRTAVPIAITGVATAGAAGDQGKDDDDYDNDKQDPNDHRGVIAA